MPRARRAAFVPREASASCTHLLLLCVYASGKLRWLGDFEHVLSEDWISEQSTRLLYNELRKIKLEQKEEDVQIHDH